MYRPTGRPSTDSGVGSANCNLSVLWLTFVLLTSLNSLNFFGSKQPAESITSYCCNTIVNQCNKKKMDYWLSLRKYFPIVNELHDHMIFTNTFWFPFAEEGDGSNNSNDNQGDKNAE